jgi:hypothetical protein
MYGSERRVFTVLRADGGILTTQAAHFYAFSMEKKPPVFEGRNPRFGVFFLVLGEGIQKCSPDHLSVRAIRSIKHRPNRHQIQRRGEGGVDPKRLTFLKSNCRL